VIGTIIIEAIFINTINPNIIIEILLDPITEAIITQAILSAILLDEPGRSVADRLQCACPVLVAERVDGADAGDVPRRQDAFDFASQRDLQNSEVSSRSARDSQLLAVSKSLTASNCMSRLTCRPGTHFIVLSGAQLELGPLLESPHLSAGN
jgi:hypothetical protein